MAKKSVRKKKCDDVDVNIKVSNIDKAIKLAKNHERVKQGGSFWVFGSALAMILSYAKTGGIFWAILHGILSWFYVIYRIIIDYGIFN